MFSVEKCLWMPRLLSPSRLAVGFPRWLSGKESACNVGDASLIPWRRKWHPTPVFLPGKSHGQRSLVAYIPQGVRVRHDWETKQRVFCWDSQIHPFHYCRPLIHRISELERTYPTPSCSPTGLRDLMDTPPKTEDGSWALTSWGPPI